MSNRAEDNWKRRAEKAEIRVAELEAQLAVAHKLHGYAGIEKLRARVAELEADNARLRSWDEACWKAEKSNLVSRVAELEGALRWALPLAEIALEQCRQNRLQYGHDDIGRGTSSLGLWPDEVARRDNARAVLNGGRA